MGKSIYERADDAMRYRSRIYEEPASYDFKSGYEKGATELKAIDIEKACEYWAGVFDRDDYGLGVHTEKAIERFRKAMEE